MDRRGLLKSAGLVAATGAGFGSKPATALEVEACGLVAEPATIVLVHGAHGGGHNFSAVADILRRRGHRVFNPTLTGLGERSHLLSREINLTTHVTDILNVLSFEQLENVVLVGTSYGGFVSICVADQHPEKIRSLVMLDAQLPQGNQSIAEIAGQTEIAQAAWDAGIMTRPAPDVPGAEPHPLGTFLERPQLTGAWRDIAKRTYIRANPGLIPTIDASHEALAEDTGWIIDDIDGPHNFPTLMPERTAELVEAAI